MGNNYVEIVEEQESFDFPIGDSVFQLRRLASAKYKEIQKKYTTTKKDRQGRPYIDVDEDAVNEDLLDYLIIGWGIIKSPTSGQDIECTYDNKQKLPGTVKQKIIEACDTERVTVQEKNADSSPS